MPTNSEVNPTNLERRDLLKGLAVVLGAAISPACQRAAEVPAAQRMAGVARWSLEQRAIAHRCADLIMPATDTPSALAVGVGEFMDYVASVWLQQSELEELLAGLNGLQEEAQRQYTKNFVDLSEMEQVQLLTQMETASSVLNASSQEELRSKVFARLKELTVVGYYSSEVGAKQERVYVPMPGRYDGYFKLNKVGRQWSS
jgi:gluconate 2-dehydrogenase gamma chain